MSEKQTRQEIIDKRLLQAGWDVKNPTQVVSEHEVLHQFGKESGIGFSDYVLMGRDGKPIAVIEAKKTAADARKGREQAKQYADGFEKMYGVRPLIFYTNGYDIYFWDDTRYPPRKVFSFFTLDDLERIFYQNRERHPLSHTLINTSIAGRPYQVEAIRRVLEGLTNSRRKSLLVMATGTGKTRVAMALVDVLMRANWVKRVLFLADRKELLKQARDAFKEHLPNSPYVWIKSGDCPPEKRVYLSTYPTMHQIYTEISSGFFDLIIADESHRSIYKRWKEIFDHFDSYQVGLTATPIDFVERNTFRMFELEDGVPTFNYSYDEALNNNPPYLVPFKALRVRSQFQIEGIRGETLSSDERQQIEDEGLDLDEINFEGTDLEKKVTNAPSNEIIVRQFMEESIKDKNGVNPTKSIIFATSHNHALRLEEIFNQLYPQYHGKLARVIDSHDPRASTEGGLLDQFKDPKNPLTVAISVDMLDTGVDVPEVCNLVFAKPVFSRSKFWQMIGRGTRLCSNLFGPGIDKKEFLIIDHWNNFAYFSMNPEGKEPSEGMSVPERLFLNRIKFAEACLQKNRTDLFQLNALDMRDDISKLNKESVVVKERMALISQALESLYWEHLDQRKLDELRTQGLQALRAKDVDDFEATKFDSIILAFKTAIVLENTEAIETFVEQITDMVSELPLTLNQVKAKEPIIRRILNGTFWSSLSIEDLENMRIELRGLMKYIESQAVNPIKLDLRDIVVEKDQVEFGPELERTTTAEYRRRVEERVRELLSTNLILQKIKNGEDITSYEVLELTVLLENQDPYITESLLKSAYDNKSAKFIDFVKHILGLKKLRTRTEFISEAFDDFIRKHNTFTADQIQFLHIIKTFIIEARVIPDKPDLVEAPFTNFNNRGILGVFPMAQIDEILGFVQELGNEVA